MTENRTGERDPRLAALMDLAFFLGAGEAKIIPAGAVTVKNHLADLCWEPGCDYYGLSPGCPPHVFGPEGFRELRKKARLALVIRIMVPTAALFSDEGVGILRLLHETTAGVERAAVQMGFWARAFAGGSCKKIFCGDRAACAVLETSGECRHMDFARPSMSGFGIDVSALMTACGWQAHPADREKSREDSLSWVAGLVLLG